MTEPKYFVEKDSKYVVKVFEWESEYIDFALFFIVAVYLGTLYLFVSKEDKLKIS